MNHKKFSLLMGLILGLIIGLVFCLFLADPPQDHVHFIDIGTETKVHEDCLYWDRTYTHITHYPCPHARRGPPYFHYITTEYQEKMYEDYSESMPVTHTTIQPTEVTGICGNPESASLRKAGYKTCLTKKLDQ